MTATEIPALIIFARNPVQGKVKTRLARDVGPEAALRVYNHLLQHTVAVAAAVPCSRFVYYDDMIAEADVWPGSLFAKRLQQGHTLGQRMQHAFAAVLQQHCPAVIIGTDCRELLPAHIETAVERLQHCDVVLGPAADGGYYLLGMNRLHPALFEDIAWSSHQVLAQTLEKISQQQLSYSLLQQLHDVDTGADLARHTDLLQLVEPPV